jgi:hypothetical protein
MGAAILNWRKGRLHSGLGRVSQPVRNALVMFKRSRGLSLEVRPCGNCQQDDGRDPEGGIAQSCFFGHEAHSKTGNRVCARGAADCGRGIPWGALGAGSLAKNAMGGAPAFFNESRLRGENSLGRPCREQERRGPSTPLRMTLRVRFA